MPKQGPTAKRAAARARLKDAIVSWAKRAFTDLFGVDYPKEWGDEVLRHIRQLAMQDVEGRRVAANIRRTPNKVRELVKKYGLDKNPYRPGTAPTLAALAAVTRGTTQEMKKWFLSDDPIARERPFGSLRSCMIYFFESVPARCDETKGTFADLGRWKREGYNAVRVLTDRELVAIMICIRPSSVTLSGQDLVVPPEDAVLVVIARERRAMKDARKKYGTEQPPRTSTQRAAEKAKTALLPRPQGDTTLIIPP